MKKSVLFGIVIILLLGATVFAQENVDPDLEDFVKDVAKSKGVSEEKVKGIKKVDFRNLPNEVKLQNIDETNLALYEIEVEAEKPVYVITASKELFEKTIVAAVQRSFLSFGKASDVIQSTTLGTASGVESGYVMTRSGSITGLSTVLDITEKLDNLPIEIIIMKNSQEIGFRNAFNTNNTGIHNDYDLISANTIDFKEGDIISVKINIPNGAKVKDISTLMEIETK